MKVKPVSQEGEMGRPEAGLRERSAIAALIDASREVLFEIDSEAIRSDRSLKDLGASSIERFEILTEALHAIQLELPLVKLQEVAGMTLAEIASVFERWRLQGRE